MSSRLLRLERAVNVCSAADRARLAGCLAAMRKRKTEAQVLRAQSRALSPGADVAEMLASSRWHLEAERRARAALAEAAAFDTQAMVLRQRFALSLARQRAVGVLAADEVRAAARARGRRAEDLLSVLRASSQVLRDGG